VFEQSEFRYSAAFAASQALKNKSSLDLWFFVSRQRTGITDTETFRFNEVKQVQHDGKVQHDKKVSA
jgi:hypothetical protein